MPVPDGVSKEKFDSCVAKVQAKGEVDNAYAVCTAALTRSGGESEALAVASDIARIVPTLSPEAVTAFRSAYDAAVTDRCGPRVALRRAMVAVHSLICKREDPAGEPTTEPVAFEKINSNCISGDLDKDGDRDFACFSCMAIQPECACHACGEIGPGVYCIACGAPVMPGNCPSCGVLWNPVLVEEMDQEGMSEMRTLNCELLEHRDFPDRGELVGWASSEILDAHGTVILPESVLMKALSGSPQMDVEHDGRGVAGITFTDFHPAKRRVVDPETKEERLVEGVSFVARCNLALDGARSVYERFKSGALKAFSIGFRMAQELKEKIDSGVTRTIDAITDLPFISAVAKPSNSASILLEMRSAAITKALTRIEMPATPATVPAQTVTASTTVDVLDSLRQEAASLAGSPPPPVTATPPADPAPVAAPPADDVRFAEIAARIDSLTATVQEIRAASPSRDWEPGIASLTTGFQEIRASLQQVTSRADKSDGQIDKLVGILRDLVPQVRMMLEKRVAELKAPLPRIGTPGSIEESRAVAEIQAMADKKGGDRLEVEKRIKDMALLTPPR